MTTTLKNFQMTNSKNHNQEIFHQEDIEKNGEVGDNENQQQYYTFTNPKLQHSLHVIDADHGVFDSPTHRKKTINFKFRTPKIFKKIKENQNFNDNNDNKYGKNNLEDQIILSSFNDNFKLRPEPELVDSHINIYSNNDKRNRNNNEKFIPTNTIYSNKEYRHSIPLLDDSDESDYSYNSFDTDYEPPNDEYSTFKKSNIISNNKIETDNYFKKSKNIHKSAINYNHKSKIEQEYEKIKLKAARYQAERDMLKIKLQHKQMATKLRDYEYYCINGINHGELLNDNINNENFNKSYITQQQLLQQRQLLKLHKNSRLINKSKKSSSSNNSIGETNFFDKLSTNLPPEISSFLERYSDHIPSVQTIREFHNSVLSWILTIPFLSLLYPVLCFLGVLIPKKTKRNWSFRALIIGFLDLSILLITGWIVYNFLRFLVGFLSSFVKVAKFLGIL